MEGWTDESFKQIRHQSYGYLLHDGYLWKRLKQRDGVPLRVVNDVHTKEQILTELHDGLWVGHRGTWATYTKVKEMYWWTLFYQDVAKFVGSCVKCQLQSKIQYIEDLHPMYLHAMYF